MTRAIRIGVVLLSFIFMGIAIFYYGRGALSEILISDRMSDFIDKVDRHKAKMERKLIIFDLDDTVFMSSQILGTPTWFYNMVNILRHSGAAEHEAYSIVNAIDRIVQEEVVIMPVEQATLSAIRSWQSMGATVLGVTSRHKDLATITAQQLNTIGLQFSSSYFSCVEKTWNHDDTAFVRGVLYAGGSLTSDTLFNRLFDSMADCGAEHQMIGHANDQQRYITIFAKAAKNLRLDYIGIIYGGALRSRIFDLAEAKRQLLNLEARLEIPIIPHEYRGIFVDENAF